MGASHQTSDVFADAREVPFGGLVLRSGRQLHFRPIGPDDANRLAELFDRLSPESRYRRFLSPKPRLEPRELAYLTNLDYFEHDAIAAVDGGDGSIVGVGRYARETSRPWAAHIAVAVADELHRLGIGTLLAGLAVARASANGYELLIASTLWDNRPARALLRRLGFRACSSDGGIVELQLALPIRN
jgi:RimJ/RimL family protein N-acetyltransferase